jgi:membrane associated rhomboid family serine protease
VLPVRDLNPRRRPARVTWTLLAVTVAAFAVQLGLFGQRAAFEMLRVGAFLPAAFVAEPLARAHTLWTSAFLHGDLWHLVGNLFFLGVFGDNVEERMGPARYLAFYLLGAAAASLAHGVASGWSPVPLVGASGAISAVLGAYVLWFPSRRVQAFVAPLFVPWLLIRVLLPVPRFYLWWLPAWLYIGYWALVQVFEAGGTLVVGDVAAAGVAWWAHVGGFAFGLAGATWRGLDQAGSIRP